MSRFILIIAGIVFFTEFTFARNISASKHFDKVIIIVFENTKYQKVLKQPFFSQLAENGALLTNFYAETHPSQGNYIALVSGSTHGVNTDSPVNLDVNHVGDLLDKKGLNWKVYAEKYPGNCYLGNSGDYVRKHNPFMSFISTQQNKERCDHIVNALEFDQDVKNDTLPSYSLYIPDMRNDGHDTGVTFADNWFENKFGGLLQDSRFMKGMLLVVTFDEGSFLGDNHIYTTLYGNMVANGVKNNSKLNHYSILKLIEDEFELGNLGLFDLSATQISGVWN